MVKTFEPLPECENLVLEQYKVEFIIRAREIGNLEGIDNYVFTLELKSKEKIENDDELDNVGIPMIKSLTIYLPDTGDTLVVNDERIENPELTRKPIVFRNEVYEYFQIGNIVITDRHENIIVTAELNIYDRMTLELQKTESVIGEFKRILKKKWYRE